MRTSISDKVSYIQAVRRALEDDEFFKNFKKDPGYREVLEHVSGELGRKYLQVILQNSPHYHDYNKISKFRENDQIGDPATHFYDEIGTNISPTTLRYVKVASDLENLYGDLRNLNVVEIGCGYGGQSKILMDLFAIKSYTYIDLDDVLELARKYIDSFPPTRTNLNFLPFNEVRGSENKYDLVISNYAFTECTTEIQDVYLEKIINQSERGYITCNFISGIFDLQSYSLLELMGKINKNPSHKEEVPLSYPGNCIIGW